MNNKLIFAMGFVLGGLAGVLGTREYFKKKYEEISQEEIDSVKEVWSERNPIQVTKTEEKEEKTVAKTDAKWNKPDITEYSSVSSIIKSNGYSETEEKRTSERNRPYVIRPEEFGDMEGEGYESVSLTYYLDGTLAEGREVIDNIDETIGLVSLNHFGEYEDDSVFVRNDKFKCDYEILLDQRSFDEAMK